MVIISILVFFLLLSSSIDLSAPHLFLATGVQTLDVSLDEAKSPSLQHLAKSNVSTGAFNVKGLVFDLGGQIIGIGGDVYTRLGILATREIWTMDKCTGETRQVATLPQPITGPAATKLKSGNIWITGGSNPPHSEPNQSKVYHLIIAFNLFHAYRSSHNS